MKKKFKSWFKRYLPAEIACTIGAILAPTLLAFYTDNLIALALAATWGENLGFYGTMLIQELREKEKLNLKNFYKSIRNITIEFGLAESIDSFLTRPAIIFFTTSYIENLQLAVLVGKIAADIIFYIPAIIGYELRKKHLKD